MRISYSVLLLTVAAALWLMTGCASQSTKPEQPRPPAAPATASDAETGETPADLTAEEETLLEGDIAFEQEAEYQDIGFIADPFEPINRAIFTFNDTLYVYLLKPVSLGYRKITPTFVRTGLSNFFTNLTTPIRFTNCLLQGKGQAATAEASKFLFNSTFGILGFGDLFKNFPEMYPDNEDLGQTLGAYGIGDGFYIVLPLLGASTLRDSAGIAGDVFFHPLFYVDSATVRWTAWGVDRVNKLSFRIEDIDAAKKAAFDPYEANRNFYIQLRQSKIAK